MSFRDSIGRLELGGSHLVHPLLDAGCDTYAFSRSQMATGIDGVAWYKYCKVSLAEITDLKLSVCAVPI